MIVDKIPVWEAELWSYLSNAEGDCCPSYNSCQSRQIGDWCLYDVISQSHGLEGQKFDINNLIFSSMGPPEKNTPCYRILDSLENLAYKLLKEGGIKGPPVPTELISQFDSQYPIEVKLLPLKMCHGAVWRSDSRWIIQLKKDDSPATRRFTLFHEAFHILTRNKITPECKKLEVRRGEFSEFLADSFAVFILMPYEWIDVRWAEVHDLNQMAKIFEVPKTAMYIMLKTHGLMR